jgi:hypothetical protein
VLIDLYIQFVTYIHSSWHITRHKETLTTRHTTQWWWSPVLMVPYVSTKEPYRFATQPWRTCDKCVRVTNDGDGPLCIQKSFVNPKSTSNQSSKPCTVLQYPSRNAYVWLMMVMVPYVSTKEPYGFATKPWRTCDKCVRVNYNDDSNGDGPSCIRIRAL